MALPDWAAALIGLATTGMPQLGMVINSSIAAAQPNENGQTGWEHFGDWISGKTNTDAVNSATAALQEDAQVFNAEEAEKQRVWEADQAEIARQWQEKMSNSAYQRSVADLQAAGLNPWLAAGSSGASTGSVGIAPGDSASSAQGQAINASRSGAEMLMMAGITAGALIKLVKLLRK